MRLIIALFIPWLTFFTIGRPIAGVSCLLLQLTLIGWLPATIWAVYALSQYKTDKKIKQAIEAVGVDAAPVN
ncbi:twitching motility protein PilT [Burkholderiales bacterium GJ-E10]|nr:twitching motility protein PilT [Burkholderiales bacterium GJ-E10]